MVRVHSTLSLCAQIRSILTCGCGLSWKIRQRLLDVRTRNRSSGRTRSTCCEPSVSFRTSGFREKWPRQGTRLLAGENVGLYVSELRARTNTVGDGRRPGDSTKDGRCLRRRHKHAGATESPPSGLVYRVAASFRIDRFDRAQFACSPRTADG